jgi:hypothetical protein
MKFRLLAISCIVLPVCSRASFEMALVADNTPGPLTAAQIHRFDTVTGAYLGAFGRFSGIIRDIAIDQSKRRLFSIDNATTLSAYDYNTGLFVGARSISATSINVVGNEVWAQSSATIFKFDTNLNSLGSMNIGTSQTVLSTQIVNGSIFTLETPSATSYQVRRYSLGGSLLSSGGTILTTNIVSKLGYIGYTPDTSTTGLLTFGTGSGSTVGFVTLSGATMLVSGTYSPSFGTLYKDFAPLHVGGVMIGQDTTDTSKGVITVTGPTSAANIGGFGQSILKNPIAVATVVAPEPMSLAFLALGASALLRKRRP